MEHQQYLYERWHSLSGGWMPELLDAMKIFQRQLPPRSLASQLIHILSLMNSRAQSLARPMAHMFVFYSGRDQPRPENLSFWHSIGLWKTVYKSFSKVLDTDISVLVCHSSLWNFHLVLERKALLMGRFMGRITPPTMSFYEVSPSIDYWLCGKHYMKDFKCIVSFFFFF